MDEPPAGVTTTELASEAVELPTRGPLLAGLAVAGFGVLLLVVIRFVRSRRS
jgi:hypothetical protein